MTITWLIPGTGIVPETPDGPAALVAPADVPNPTLPIDHIEAALARLPHQYRQRCDGTAGETNTQKVIRCLMAPAADLETALLAVLNNANVDNATGFLLDLVGKWVGRARNGVADDEIYRRYIRAQIVVNRSDGVINDILAVARLVVDDPDVGLILRNDGIAAYVLQVSSVALDPDVVDVLVRLVVKATSAGVRPIIEYAISAPDDVFQFDDGPGFDVGHYSTSVDHVS